MNDRPTQQDLEPGDVVVLRQYHCHLMNWSALDLESSSYIHVLSCDRLISFPTCPMLLVGKTMGPRHVYTLLTREQGIINLDMRDLNVSKQTILVLERIT